ncbi:MAG: DUF3108 domain-containing protein, partial [Zoogloeaceae bacterium]|nr:DUF3108 domain-containing protein [Zoogloeaceae bacterium]
SRADAGKEDSASVWPEKGAVEYRVSYGESGPTLGQAHYSWSHDGKKYQMRLALKTTGAVAALHKFDYVQMSQGDIEKEGLRPLQFDVNHQGKPPDMALFDWDEKSGARVSIRRGGKERKNLELAPGDQDVLSIWRQIGHVDKLPDNLLVVANKSARRAKVVSLGDATLKVPAGQFATRHFNSRSDDGRQRLDFWLASSHHMVPVRIILGDSNIMGSLVLEATALHIPAPDPK